VAFGTSSLGDPVSPATQHPVGTVWTAFTPVGTGVNFGAGVVLVLGLLVGVVGVILGCVALLGFRRAARSSR
jgi:hypothetical protein